MDMAQGKRRSATSSGATADGPAFHTAFKCVTDMQVARAMARELAAEQWDAKPKPDGSRGWDCGKLAAMADDDKPTRPFPVEVVVNGVKVTVTLMLKPGVTVEVSAPEQANDAARDNALRGPETGTGPHDKAR